VFGTCKIFHYWLGRSAVENRQTYPFVTIDTGHWLLTSLNMYFKFKISFVIYIFKFVFAFLERNLYVEDELFYTT